MKLQQLISLIPKGLILSANKDLGSIEINNLTANSNDCKKNTLFIATKGATDKSLNGHDFIEHAISNNAAAIVIDKSYQVNKSYPVPILTAKDSKEALCFLAEAFFGFPSHHLTVVGITGTNGKTSTSFMLHSILKQAGLKTRIMGTLGIGEPSTLTPLSHTTMDPVFISRKLFHMLEKGVNHVIMEVSSHALSLKRCEAIKFTAVGLTNTTQDHLDFHGTIENYYQAKKRLFTKLATDQTIKVLPQGHHFLKDDSINRHRLITYKQNDTDNFHEKNARLAQTLAQELGVDHIAIEQGLKLCPRIPGRMETVCSKPFKVVVDFAHTPHALESLLTNINKDNYHRVILVFGCGGDRDKQKRSIMGVIAQNMADLIIVTDDNPRTEDPKKIRDEITSQITTPHKFLNIASRKQAIATAISQAKSNDIVIIAGKGHEDYQIYDDNKIYFSDYETAKSILEEI